MLNPLPFKLGPPTNQPRVVSGLEVEQAVRDARLRGPSALAMLAAEIAPCVIKNLTVAQLCRLVGEYDVSRGYITTARGLKPAEKAAVCAGTAPLSHFHNQYRKNRAADRLVKKLGVECVWAAIERATAPAIAAE